MNAEEWRWVPGREGRYKVSSFGRVKSFLFSEEGKLMKLDVASNGYVRVHFQFKKTWLVHRLVATVFLANPLGLPTVNHLDGDPRSNHVSNLEWASYSDNMRHSWRKLESYKNRKLAVTRGDDHASSKLTANKVRAMRAEYAAGGTSHAKLAKKYGVSKPGARVAIQGKTWAHVE